jgi:outer membrane protein assembly factor BamB
MLRDRYGDVTLEVDGRAVPARVFVEKQLEREEFRRIAAATGLPDVPVPVEKLWAVDEGRDSMTRLLPVKGVISAGMEGMVFVYSDGMLFGREARTGRVLWRHPAPSLSLDTHLGVCSGNLVLEGNDTVSALAPDRGLAVWEYRPGRPVLETAANDETVFVLLGHYRPNAPRTLVALEGQRGRILWQRDLDGRFREWMLLTPELVVVQATRPPAIHVLDALTGRLHLEIKAERQVHREPFLTTGSQLVAIRGNHDLDLWDLAAKRKVWTYRLPDERYFRSAISLGNQVLLTDMSDTLRLLDGTRGEEIWSTGVPDGRNLAQEGESGDDDHVYVVHRDSEGRYTATALSRVDGSVDWATSLIESRAAHIRPIPTHRSVIYHVNSFQLDHNRWESRTLVLDRSTGKILQRIVVPEIQGGFSEVVVGPGLMGFHGRGRVVIYGSAPADDPDGR